MTTKKGLLIAVGIVAALALVVAIVAGGIVGFVFYRLDHSEATQTAKTFLRQNDKLKQQIGEVRDFGYFTTGDIATQGAPGNAELRLKTIGAKKTVNATVELASRAGRDWRVVDAFYDDATGQRIYLTENFNDANTGSGQNLVEAGDEGETDSQTGSEAGDGTATDDGDETTQQFDEQSFKANVLESKSPVLVVIGSDASLDSRALEETVRSLAPKYEEKIDLVEYDVTEQPTLLQRFNVKSVPAIIVFKNGAEQERRTGKLSADELSRLLDKYLQQ